MQLNMDSFLFKESLAFLSRVPASILRCVKTHQIVWLLDAIRKDAAFGMRDMHASRVLRLGGRTANVSRKRQLSAPLL